MGIRVEYWLGAADGLESLLMSHMPAFRDWYEEQATEPNSDMPLEVLETAENIIAKGHAGFMVSTRKAATRIDDLVDAFVGDYCDLGPGTALLPAVGKTSMSVRHYEACLPYFDRDSEAYIWWQYVLNGRPVARDAQMLPYQCSDSVFRVAFASWAELAPLHTALRKVRVDCLNGAEAIYAMREAMEIADDKKAGLIVTVA